MKNLLIFLVVVGLVMVGGKHAFEKWQKGETVSTAERRVSGILHNLDENQDQTALCQWARGGVMMTTDEMEAYTDKFDQFVRATGFSEPMSWKVTEAVLQEDLETVLVKVSSNRRDLTLRVVDDEPISVAN